MDTPLSEIGQPSATRRLSSTLYRRQLEWHIDTMCSKKFYTDGENLLSYLSLSYFTKKYIPDKEWSTWPGNPLSRIKLQKHKNIYKICSNWNGEQNVQWNFY